MVVCPDHYKSKPAVACFLSFSHRPSSSVFKRWHICSASFPVSSAILECGMDSGMLLGPSHTHRHWKFLSAITGWTFVPTTTWELCILHICKDMFLLGRFYFSWTFLFGDLQVIFSLVFLKIAISLFFILFVVFNWLQGGEWSKVSFNILR